MNKKRKKGFYWVKIYVRYNTQRWVVSEFDGDYWYFQGCRYEDHNFFEIDENRIERKQ